MKLFKFEITSVIHYEKSKLKCVLDVKFHKKLHKVPSKLEYLLRREKLNEEKSEKSIGKRSRPVLQRSLSAARKRSKFERLWRSLLHYSRNMKPQGITFLKSKNAPSWRIAFAEQWKCLFVQVHLTAFCISGTEKKPNAFKMQCALDKKLQSISVAFYTFPDANQLKFFAKNYLYLLAKTLNHNDIRLRSYLRIDILLHRKVHLERSPPPG